MRRLRSRLHPRIALRPATEISVTGAVTATQSEASFGDHADSSLGILIIIVGCLGLTLHVLDGGDRDQDEAEGGPRPAKRGRFAVPSCVTCLFEGLSESGRAALADAVEVRVRIGKGIRLRILEASPEQQGRLVEQAVDEAASSSSGPGALEPPPSSAPQLDPYGSALWPSALVLSQAVVAHAAAFRSAKAKPSSAGAPATGLSQVEPELQLLELGAGCGLAALTAATLGLNVLATDFRDLPLELLAASARRHGLGARLKTELFDICDLSVPLPAADLVMASDVLYDRQTAIAMAERVAEARRRGSVVLVADCGRPNRDVFLGTLRRILKTEDTVDGLDFNCHGVAVQRVDDSASSFCRKATWSVRAVSLSSCAVAMKLLPAALASCLVFLLRMLD
ncbi:unnamed protein product [Polarella glacialis]|uniref:Calmodulin-lysine N-methyltransferase n=1 Tax=Polarella glacialis TaxID=89957 RepID=A0A813KNA6_POLGL|nr:unnamed protein product [Polarella glacialis]